jgi:hypothetical protein
VAIEVKYLIQRRLDLAVFMRFQGYNPCDSWGAIEPIELAIIATNHKS